MTLKPDYEALLLLGSFPPSLARLGGREGPGGSFFLWFGVRSDVAQLMRARAGGRKLKRERFAEEASANR